MSEAELWREIKGLQKQIERLQARETLSLAAPLHTAILTQAFAANTWYAVFAPGTLIAEAIYLIEFRLGNSSSEPWIASAVALVRPVLTNSAGYMDVAMALLTSTHTAGFGTPAQFQISTYTVAGHVSSGVQLKFLSGSAPAGSTLVVNAFRLR